MLRPALDPNDGSLSRPRSSLPRRISFAPVAIIVGVTSAGPACCAASSVPGAGALPPMPWPDVLPRLSSELRASDPRTAVGFTRVMPLPGEPARAPAPVLEPRASELGLGARRPPVDALAPGGDELSGRAPGDDGLPVGEPGEKEGDTGRAPPAPRAMVPGERHAAAVSGLPSAAAAFCCCCVEYRRLSAW